MSRMIRLQHSLELWGGGSSIELGHRGHTAPVSSPGPDSGTGNKTRSSRDSGPEPSPTGQLLLVLPEEKKKEQLRFILHLEAFFPTHGAFHAAGHKQEQCPGCCPAPGQVQRRWPFLCRPGHRRHEVTLPLFTPVPLYFCIRASTPQPRGSGFSCSNLGVGAGLVLHPPGLRSSRGPLRSLVFGFLHPRPKFPSRIPSPIPAFPQPGGSEGRLGGIAKPGCEERGEK